MTIEQKALELVNAVERDLGYARHETINAFDRTLYAVNEALCRALEAHELDKSRHAAEMREQAERFEAFRQEVSDALKMYSPPNRNQALERFILAPVDPLVEAMQEALDGPRVSTWEADCAGKMATILRAALEARGLAIVKKEAVNG